MGATGGRWGAWAGLAALAAGAGGVAFERADPDVLAAGPREYAAWVAIYRTELLLQSLLFVLSAGFLLVFFAGLRDRLARRERSGAPYDDGLSTLVLGAGTAWVVVTLVAQSGQAAMAYVSAGPGSAATTVAAMGDVVTVLLAFGNVPVVVLLAATAVVGLRWHALPGWLGWFSALAAVLHLAPVAGVVLETGPLSPEGWVPYLVYPAFVVWLLGTTVVLARAPGAAAEEVSPAAGRSRRAEP